MQLQVLEEGLRLDEDSLKQLMEHHRVLGQRLQLKRRMIASLRKRIVELQKLTLPEATRGGDIAILEKITSRN